MPLTFHELILDTEHVAPNPQGGPEFSHAVVSVPASGVEDINRNRPSALHRYVIDQGALNAERRQRLYSFFLAVGGIGGAFRMVAPEPHNQYFENELLGTGDGSRTEFKLIKTHSFTAESYYGGASSSYVQRIVKPIYGEVEIYKAGALVDLEAAGAMNWTEGKYVFDTAPTAGQEVRATGRYHLPVRFTSDWLSMTHHVTSEWQGVEIQEVLPKTIGING